MPQSRTTVLAGRRRLDSARDLDAKGIIPEEEVADTRDEDLGLHGSSSPGPGSMDSPSLAVLAGAIDITAADFNSDGKPDLAILHVGESQFATNGLVRVYLQQ